MDDRAAKRELARGEIGIRRRYKLLELQRCCSNALATGSPERLQALPERRQLEAALALLAPFS